jgi:hypothetical protein
MYSQSLKLKLAPGSGMDLTVGGGGGLGKLNSAKGTAAVFEEQYALALRDAPRHALADIPSSFAWTKPTDELTWAWQEFGLGAFQERLKKYRSLLDSARTFPSMSFAEFDTKQWLLVTGALFQSFNRLSKPLLTIGDLDENDRQQKTKAAPRLMCERGLFGDVESGIVSTIRPIVDFDELKNRDPATLGFSVRGYSHDQVWSSDRRNVLGSSDGLLLLMKGDPNDRRLVVQIEPLDPRVLTRPELFNFFELLAAKKIPFELYAGPQGSVRDGYFRLYNASALPTGSRRMPLFPQERSTLPSTGRAPRLETFRIDSRSISDATSVIQLTSMNRSVGITRESDGRITLQLGNNRATSFHTPPFVQWVNSLFDPAVTKFGEVVIADLNLFIPPEHSAFDMSGLHAACDDKIAQARNETVKTKNSTIVDPTATELFQNILGRFEHGGAVSLAILAKDLGVLFNPDARCALSKPQEKLLNELFGNYMVSALSRGQLLDIADMDKVMNYLKTPEVIIRPEEARVLRDLLDAYFSEHKGAAGAIFRALACVNQRSVTFEVRALPLVHHEDPIIKPNTDAGFTSRQSSMEVDGHFDNPGLAYYQDKGRERMRYFLQEHLTGVDVTDEFVGTMVAFSQIFYVATGRSGDLVKLTPEFAYHLTSFLEHVVGRELPDMYRAFSPSAREYVLKLRAKDEEQRQISLN